MEGPAKSRFLELMKSLVMRPPLHAVYRVEDIWLISHGFLIGVSNDKDEAHELFDGFEVFTKSYFGISNVDVGWCHSIRLNSESDKHSIALFAQLFYQYLVEQKHISKEEIEDIDQWVKKHSK